MTPDQVTSFEQLEGIYRSGGWVGFASACVYLFVKWYKAGWFDVLIGRIMPSWRWTESGRYQRLFVVGAASVVAAMLGGVAAGQAWYLALAAAIPVAIGAIGVNETKQTVEKAAAEQAQRIEHAKVMATTNTLSLTSSPPSAKEIYDDMQREKAAHEEAKKS